MNKIFFEMTNDKKKNDVCGAVGLDPWQNTGQVHTRSFLVPVPAPARETYIITW